MNVQLAAATGAPDSSAKEEKPSTPQGQPEVDLKSLTPGSDEYNAAMVAKAQQARGEVATTETATETPAKSPEQATYEIPEKFRNADGTPNVQAILKSYSEMEKKQSAPAKAPAATPEAPPAEAPVAETLDAAIELATAEFLDKGDFSPETLEALKKFGVSEALARKTAANEKAVRDASDSAAKAEVLAVVGGEAGFNELNAWVSANLSQEDIELFQSQIDASPKSAVVALKGLQAMRQAAEGGAKPKFVQGTPSSQSTDIFQSKESYIAAMKDPRYAKSDDYRKSVYDKLARSRAAGQSW